MDINDQIADNKGLIYQQLMRFNLQHDQDAESYAYEALYRAILTYNQDAGAAFSTYAVCVIANAMRKHLRTLNKKRQLDVTSYYDVTSSDTDAQELLSTICDSRGDAESIVLFNELSDAVDAAFSKVIKTLPCKQQHIIEAWYDSDYKLTQSELAKSLGISQPTVSRALSVFKYRLRVELEEYL